MNQDPRPSPWQSESWPDMRDCSVNDRILFAFKRAKERDSRITYEKLGEAAGVGRAAVSHWFSKDPQTRTAPRLERIESISDLVGAPSSWILTGDPQEQKLAPPSLLGDSYFKGRVRAVPIVSWVAASHWKDAVDPYPVGEGQDTELMADVGPHAFVLRVEGPSMEPEFRQGSYIVVDPDVTVNPGDYVVAKLMDSDEATFKQLVKDGGKLFLRPLNPQFQTIPITNDVVICGAVVRDFRRRK